MKQRAVSLILAVALLGSNLMPIGAWANEDFYQADSTTELEGVIFTAIQNREPAFKVRYSGSTADIIDVVRTARDNAVQKDPYEEGSISLISGFKISDFNDYADISFASFQYFTTKEQEAFVHQEVERITAQLITPGMTEHQKLKTIHDYIIKQVSYDYSLTGYTAYSALTEGVTVCNGYVQLAYKLLNRIGIETKVVKGTVENKNSTKDHTWLLVKLAGSWYHLDPTLNDDLSGSGSSPYPYYNLSDAEILVDHSFDQAAYPAAPQTYQLPAANNTNDKSGGNSGNTGANPAYTSIKLNGYFSEVLAADQVVAALDKSRMLALIGSSASSATVYELEVSKQASSYELGIPVEVITKLYSKNPKSCIRVKTNLGWYDLPSSELANSTQAGFQEANIIITISKVAGTVAQDVARLSAQSGLVLICDPISFRVELENGGSRTKSGKWSKFVARTIVLNPAATKTITDVSGANAIGLLYHPQTAQIQPVPAVLVDNEGQGLVRLPNQNDGIYSAATKKEPAFTDLSGHWAKSSIERLAGKRIVQGKDAKHFDPEGKVTRAEFAAMLVRALGLTTSDEISGAKTSPNFRDVDKEWFAEPAKLAAVNGLVNGYSDGSFRPNATITREEMAVMVSRAIASVAQQQVVGSTTALGKFCDQNQVQTWAQTAVSMVNEAGIIQGNQLGEFRPQVNASRAEAITMLDRTLKYLGLIN